MSLYDTIMRRGGQSTAPGLDAVTEPVNMPELTPDLYEQMYGTLPADMPDTDVPSYGPDDRGPAMRQEDITATGGKAGKIVRAAKSMLGLPYVWGGTSASSGVDCSGLVQLAYQAAGISLPRVSFQQAQQGRQVALKALAPGDLVFWNNSSRNDGADHVAIYLGSGQIIEAPRPGTNVRIRKLGSNEGAWGVRILGGN